MGQSDRTRTGGDPTPSGIAKRVAPASYPRAPPVPAAARPAQSLADVDAARGTIPRGPPRSPRFPRPPRARSGPSTRNHTEELDEILGLALCATARDFNDERGADEHSPGQFARPSQPRTKLGSPRSRPRHGKWLAPAKSAKPQNSDRSIRFILARWVAVGTWRSWKSWRSWVRHEATPFLVK